MQHTEFFLARIIREITIKEEGSIYQINKKPEKAISETAVSFKEKKSSRNLKLHHLPPV